MAKQQIPTPYDNPVQLWERVSFPSLAVAYREGRAEGIRQARYGILFDEEIDDALGGTTRKDEQ